MSFSKITHIRDRLVGRFSFRERYESPSLLNLHRHIDDSSEFTEMLLEEVLGDGFARYVNRVAGLWLVFLRKIRLFVTFLLLLKLLIEEWDRSVAKSFMINQLKGSDRRWWNLPVELIRCRQRRFRWRVLLLDWTWCRERMIRSRFRENLLPLLTFRSLELNLRLGLWDVDVSRLDEFSSNFAGIAGVFRALWDERLLRFWFTFESL